jgi:hypothetical protein
MLLNYRDRAYGLLNTLSFQIAERISDQMISTDMCPFGPKVVVLLVVVVVVVVADTLIKILLHSSILFYFTMLFQP